MTIFKNDKYIDRLLSPINLIVKFHILLIIDIDRSIKFEVLLYFITIFQSFAIIFLFFIFKILTAIFALLKNS